MLGLPYTIGEIAEAALAQDLFQGQLQPRRLRYVAFDSRTISHGPETVFVALHSEHRDGHDFIPAAYEKGVRNFLVSQALDLPGVNYALCQDPLQSLQWWALHHRRRFPYPIIAITGSNGKTTVKEWLATLLEMHWQIVKSPGSYNSQIGVPLSLLQLHPQAELGIIEAGISQPGEMESLWAMIRPDYGILTHMGSAHDEGFTSAEAKLREKAKLFADVKSVWVSSTQASIWQDLQAMDLPLRSVGYRQADCLQIQRAEAKEGHWQTQLRVEEQMHFLDIPGRSQADLENALLALLAVHELGTPIAEVSARLPLLYPVEMRTELIVDNPEITLVNDSYNSDVDSIRNAFQWLKSLKTHPHYQIILSDIPHLGTQQEAVQRQIWEEASELAGPERVWTVGPVFEGMGYERSFSDTPGLLAHLRYEDFVNSIVLLKGARRFELERVIPRLNRKLNATYFRIDLRALADNFRWLRAQLPENTRTMCMVKAASYGSGTWEIARVLAREGAEYLAVAYASEGIELRQAQIDMPIMVMNPDDSSIEALIQYRIEPEISNFDFLARYLRAARLAAQGPYRLHLKLETGMGRLGFAEADLPDLIAVLLQHPDISVVSVLSHLAAAEDPAADAFTRAQAEHFERMYARLQRALGLQAIRHLLNTAGMLRHPDLHYDMVRLGIGLYGVNPLGPGITDLPLQEIGSLHSSISQIRNYPPQTPIGYGLSQITQRSSRIATVPVGYADGIPRALGNGKISFLVQGKRAPTFGRICMDMLMLDVTDVPEAQVGDEVLLYGRAGNQVLSVLELAQAADTIPYEILVRISQRVRRIYES